MPSDIESLTTSTSAGDDDASVAVGDGDELSAAVIDDDQVRAVEVTLTSFTHAAAVQSPDDDHVVQLALSTPRPFPLGTIITSAE